MNNLTTWFLSSENQQISDIITGTPPLTFNSNGEPLTNWKITGAQAGVGEITENLFDIDSATIGYKLESGELVEDSECFVSDYIPCQYNDVISLSFGTISKDMKGEIREYDENKNAIGLFIKAFIKPPSYPPVTRAKVNNIKIAEADAKYFRFSLQQDCADIMVTKTETAQDYEPYGYKIPIECGNTITNIYIDEPLYEDDTIGYKDTKVTIPTVDGENELSIGTSNTPTSVSIQTNGVSQGFRDYFKAQMIINNN